MHEKTQTCQSTLGKLDNMHTRKWCLYPNPILRNTPKHTWNHCSLIQYSEIHQSIHETSLARKRTCKCEEEGGLKPTRSILLTEKKSISCRENMYKFDNWKVSKDGNSKNIS